MGSKISRPNLTAEKALWTPSMHTLELSSDIREEQHSQVDGFSSNLCLCYSVMRKYGIEYQHWFVTDGETTIEFGTGEFENASVKIHENHGKSIKITENPGKSLKINPNQ